VNKMKRHPLLSFFLLTFGITWGLGAIAIPFLEQIQRIFGEPGPGNILWNIAVYSPAISAFIVIGINYGFKGIRAYLRRFLHWRVGVKWYLMVLLGIPGIYVFTSLLTHLIIGTAIKYHFSPWYMAIPTGISMIIINPGAVEEIGWRGFALPLLQSRFNALKASLILGLIWAVWHLPAFLLSPYEGVSLPIWFTSVFGFSVILTFIYNGTRGSIPLVFLSHWLINDPFQLRIYSHDQLIVTITILFIALIITLIVGYKNLGPDKFTEPLPGFMQEKEITE
jgi:hypothetical protein